MIVSGVRLGNLCARGVRPCRDDCILSHLTKDSDSDVSETSCFALA